MGFTDNLNTNQKKAVEHTEGPLLILAGAGSGKTRVITQRIAHLVKTLGVPPFSIFAVTFTNKAANEMKERVMKLIGPEGNSVFIKTFHSAALFILRNYGSRINIPRSFSIYDQSDQQEVVKEILNEMNLDPKKIKPSTIASKISEIKDKPAFLEGGDITAIMPDHFSFNFASLFEKYQEKLKKNDALDFNDLLIKTVELFRSAPEVLTILHGKWKYFMVDEYQDTNYAQYLITRHLSSRSRNICVVGDDDQSIYSWRGADIRNILNFEKDYEDALVVTLQENYRSTEQILSAASSVIKNNINRKDKKLISVKGEGELPVWCLANNEYSEAEFVINTITSLKSMENLKNSDFAIFYRTNAQSRIFEDRLRRENMHYRVVGGLKFYDRKEIKDVLAYLRFIINPNDGVSLKRILNKPARGIGKATLDKIISSAADHSTTLWKVLDDDILSGNIPKGIKEFKKIIHTLKESADSIPEKIKLSKFVRDVIELSGYRAMLAEENSIEGRSRLENIDEFINGVIDFENYEPEMTLPRFLQEISLFSTDENPEEDMSDRNNQVTLMTAHNAKGLEFTVVFLTGMMENMFPHKFSIDTEEGIEEERRLCYVGITRARERIFITSAELRRSFIGIDYMEPSRFIFEIPQDLIVMKKYYSEGFGGNSGFTGYKKNTRLHHDTNENIYTGEKEPLELTDVPAVEKNSGESKFRPREMVAHPKYGMGMILTIEGSGDNLKLTILFGTSKKTFLEKYTPLKKLN